MTIWHSESIGIYDIFPTRDLQMQNIEPSGDSSKEILVLEKSDLTVYLMRGWCCLNSSLGWSSLSRESDISSVCFSWLLEGLLRFKASDQICVTEIKYDDSQRWRTKASIGFMPCVMYYGCTAALSFSGLANSLAKRWPACCAQGRGEPSWLLGYWRWGTTWYIFLRCLCRLTYISDLDSTTAICAEALTSQCWKR